MSPPLANIRRHFLPWDRPWLGQATMWLAGNWSGQGPIDLSGVLVVVPTQQAGRRLRESLAGFAAERGAAVFAPRVLTPDALAKQDAGADIASPIETLFAWTEVLRSIDLNRFREVFPVDPSARNFAWALRIAQQFVRLQVTLADAGLRLADVSDAAGEDFVEHARWQRIAELDRLHEGRLADRGRREPQAARINAARGPLFEQGFERVVLLAVPDPSPVSLQRLAIVAAEKPVDVVVFAAENEASNFDEWGLPLPAKWEQRVVALPDFEQRVHLCADPAAQAARLAGLAEQYASAEGLLAVGVSDPEITSLLESELKRRERPVFNPDGGMMRREGLYALLSCLAELVREPSFAAVEGLARCPDFISYLQAAEGGNFSAAHWLEALDELRTDHLPADLDAARAFASKARQNELRKGLERMHELRTVLVSNPFVQGVTHALRRIFGARELERSQEMHLRFEAAAKAWMLLVREWAEAENRFGQLTVSEGWELALRLFGDQRIIEEKQPDALELQGWLELLWEDAPHLVVAGLNDGFVPESVPEDPFLPGSLRQRLGLTTSAERFARDAYLLQAIAASRRNHGRLDLVFGKTSAAGDPLRPSRLLLRCDDPELPERIAFLFRSPELADPHPSWTRAWKLTPRSVSPPARVAVTALRQYLVCPFRFYLRHVLRMERVDPLKSEIDALDFGTLCHAALEQIGLDPSLRECAEADVLRTALLRHLDRSVMERYGKLHSLPLIVQIESARQRLAKLAELQAGERAAGWEIVQVERPFEVEISGLSVRGKIDRIDRHAVSGEVRVLDYKTSDAPATPAEAHLRSLRADEQIPDWARVKLGHKPRAWADLQLPLYLHALGAEYPGKVTCGYFNLPKAAGETSLALWDDYSREIHEAAMLCAESACAAIRRGEFWPPNESIRAKRDDWAALFHHGVQESVVWPGR